MNRSRTAAVGGAAVIAVASSATPAAAASPAWHVFKVEHSSARSLMNTVVATAKNDAWAFGNKNQDHLNTTGPLAERWNGHTWRTVALPKGLTGGIVAASAPSRTDVWAVGTDSPVNDNSYVLHWNGAKWSVIKKWSFADVTGVTALSAGNVWVFGASHAGPGTGTWHYDGRRWTQYKLHFFPARASAVSAHDIWAVGLDWSTAAGRTLAHYDGKRWTRLNTDPLLPKATSVDLNGIVARSAKDVWAIGDAETISGASIGYLPFMLHWNGRKWRRVTAPGKWIPGNPVPDGHGGLWVCGITAWDKAAPVLEHRTAAGKWTSTTINVRGGRPFIGDFALIPGTTSLWATGYLGAKTGSTTNGAIYRYD